MRWTTKEICAEHALTTFTVIWLRFKGLILWTKTILTSGQIRYEIPWFQQLDLWIQHVKVINLFIHFCKIRKSYKMLDFNEICIEEITFHELSVIQYSEYSIIVRHWLRFTKWVCLMSVASCFGQNSKMEFQSEVF